MQFGFMAGVITTNVILIMCRLQEKYLINRRNYMQLLWMLKKHLTMFLGRSSNATNKGRSTVSYRQSLTFDRPYLSCDDHFNCWLFQEIFFIIIFIFLEILLNDLNLFSWNLITFTKHTEQVVVFFICSFFTCCFITILCVNALHLFVLFHCV